MAALSGPPLALWSKTLLWDYGASYIAVGLLYVGTLVMLLIINMPELVKPDLSTARPARSIGELFKIPRLSLALGTATIGFGYVTQFEDARR